MLTGAATSCTVAVVRIDWTRKLVPARMVQNSEFFADDPARFRQFSTKSRSKKPVYLAFYCCVILVLVTGYHLNAVSVEELNKAICDIRKLLDLQLEILDEFHGWAHPWKKGLLQDREEEA